MNKNQISNIAHALKNGNRFYTEANDADWNDLVDKGYATKHAGWEESMAYFKVTKEGANAKTCELCGLNQATTTVEYRDVNYDVCQGCKSLAE